MLLAPARSSMCLKFVSLTQPLQVAVGRRDATAADPDGRMPALDSSAEQLLANFADKGTPCGFASACVTAPPVA